MNKTEEKIIVKGTLCSTKIILIIGIVVSALTFVFPIINIIGVYIKYDHVYIGILPILQLVGVPAAIFGLFYLIYYCIGKCDITVTNLRVYGKAAFGRQVDLPLDLVSAVSKSNLLKSISVSTNSGQVKFNFVKNSNEVFNAISELLKVRQKNSIIMKAENEQKISQSSADELKKFKELLDMGAITQEEFDIKKKQLLGL